MTHGRVYEEHGPSDLVSCIRQRPSSITYLLSRLVHPIRDRGDIRKTLRRDLGYRGQPVELFVVLLRLCGSLGVLGARHLAENLAGRVALTADGGVESRG